jgi:hypothetical protein
VLRATRSGVGLTALAVTGVGCVVAGIVALLVPTAVAAPDDVGTVPAAPAVAPGERSTVARTVPPGPRPVRALPATPPARVAPPVAVRLPDGVVARVVPTGVDRDGVLQPPSRVREAGWWRGGAAVGDPAGTVVLAGHVDGAGQGRGAFATLRQVRPGQIVRVRTADGADVAYRVTGRRTFSRTRDLPAAVFAGDVTARLALVTCTGAFDDRTGQYADTLVVFAVPA